MAFYINQSKYILSFELDAKHIYSETLIVYDLTPSVLPNYIVAVTMRQQIPQPLNLEGN